MKEVDDILYESGLTAQGCWEQLDSYAKECIIKAIELAKEDTKKTCESIAVAWDNTRPDTNYGRCIANIIRSI